MAPRFDRYERVFHRTLAEYGHIVAPGPTGDTVMLAFRDGAQLPVQRTAVRRLRWWERLANR